MSDIHIVLDETDPQNPIFVEIETSDGKSIGIGQRENSADGFTHLVISELDIVNHPEI